MNLHTPTSGRLPVDLVHAALQVIPNQYVMTLTAAYRAKELSKGGVRKIDAALKDIAEGKIGANYLGDAIKKDVERKRKEKLQQGGKRK